MSPNRRIFLDIVATYGRGLCAVVCGVFVGRWVVAALGSGLYGVVGGMMVVVVVAFAMRLIRGRIAAVVGGECGGHPRNGIICTI